MAMGWISWGKFTRSCFAWPPIWACSSSLRLSWRVPPSSFYSFTYYWATTRSQSCSVSRDKRYSTRVRTWRITTYTACSCLSGLSVAFSFCNIAWSLVDYRRCLRRSLPYIREMPSGLPTAIYVLYKICTITSLILSYSLLLILSIYTTVALTVLWLLATIWTHLLETKFCSSRSLEFLYRAVAGVILTFTFFNVKGQDTKVAMTTYYIFCTVINIMSPSLMALLKPELQTSTLLLTISGLICGCSVLGLVCLILYYVQLHPRRVQREEDEVDDPGKETKSLARIKNFLKP